MGDGDAGPVRRRGPRSAGGAVTLRHVVGAAPGDWDTHLGLAQRGRGAEAGGVSRALVLRLRLGTVARVPDGARRHVLLSAAAAAAVRSAYMGAAAPPAGYCSVPVVKVTPASEKSVSSEPVPPQTMREVEVTTCAARIVVRSRLPAGMGMAGISTL